MSTVSDILARKGTDVVTISDGQTVLDAARLMNDRRIGSVVVQTGGTLAGILSERDILTRVVAAIRDPRSTLVREVMTSPVESCTPNTDLNDLRALMRDKRIRHVPVLDRGVLRGMVSIGDLNAHESERMSVTVESLEAYISRA